MRALSLNMVVLRIDKLLFYMDHSDKSK